MGLSSAKGLTGEKKKWEPGREGFKIYFSGGGWVAQLLKPPPSGPIMILGWGPVVILGS